MARTPNRHGGGAQTNKNGLDFEQATSLNEAFIKEGFEIKNHYDVYYNGQLLGHSINKAKFSTYFLKKYDVDYKMYNSKRWDPDEAFINLQTQTVYIIEKKFQKSEGSVDEKLATFPFKIREYQKLLTPIGFKIIYIYLLSANWFNKPKYDDYYEYMDDLGCPHYFDKLPFEAIGIYNI